MDQRRRGTRFLAHEARSVLNPPESTGIGCWSLNPYVGCEFGCSYCYARFAHRYVVERAHSAGRISPADLASYRGPHGWEGFERQIFVKQHAATMAALDRELPRVAARYERGEGHPLLIGSATDPYQPAERRFGITRAVLERLVRLRPIEIDLITKSPLVTRDASLLARLGRRHRVTVHISLISTSRRLVRMFEARSPMPHARLKALSRLVSTGVNAGLLVAPILPGITDTRPNLYRLLHAAKRHGARFAHPSALRLYAGVRPVFLPVVKQHFPNLAPRYDAAYGRAERAPGAYARALLGRFGRLAAALGVATENPLARQVLHRSEQIGFWNEPPEAP